MPLPVAHGLLGASIVAALYPQLPARRTALPLFIGALLANAADSDFLLVLALHSRAWHRGFTHSIVFSFLVCLIFGISLGRQRRRKAVAYGLAYASHAVLDYATTREGGGVEMLWPFSRERLMLGWCGLSEVPSKLPPSEILKAVALELAIFAPLFIVVMLLRKTMAGRVDTAAGAN